MSKVLSGVLHAGRVMKNIAIGTVFSAPMIFAAVTVGSPAAAQRRAMADAENALRLEPNLPLAFFVRAGSESKLGLYDPRHSRL
jgi:hypothetical protein